MPFLYIFLQISSQAMAQLMHDLTFADLVGIIAGIFSTLSFLPQALKVWRTHSTKDLSLGMYVLYTSALLLWGFYAWLIASWPLLLTEIFTLVLSLYILIMKLLEKQDFYRRKA